MLKYFIKNISLAVLLFLSATAFAAVPSGYYYFAKNKSKAELKTALHTYCGPLYVLDYGGGAGFTWEGFYNTDNRNDTVVDMYSNTIRKFSGFAAVNGMHIEHSLPKSWWGAHENNAYKDLFHLYPADGVTNSTKNNLPLGEVTGTPALDNGVSKVGKNDFGTAYTDNCFEPADEYKGDFARSYFYISTIYQNLAPLWQSPMMNNNTYPVWKPWAIDLLLKWHHQDPVSAKELARIEKIYAIQGNRNPFIDYPALADYIWGADSTKVFPFPDETEPFLLTPRRGEKVDFGVILQNDTRIHKLHILGANISTALSVRIKNQSASLTLNSSSLAAQSVIDGIDVDITFAPTVAGLVRDTLIIKGGGMADSLRVPIQGLASADFIAIEPTDVTAVGGVLQWISDPQATDYNLTLYQGDQQAGDLIISAYVEGSSWNKAIQLYNGTGKAVDLSKYTLQKQSNGAGSFGTPLHLTGTLANNSTYVIVHKTAGATLMAKANLVTDSLLQYNGNDAVRLVRSGVTIDMVGPANAGADVMWGLDLTLQRKNQVTHPATVYNASEWKTLPYDSIAFLGTHQMAFITGEPVVITQTATGKVTSFAVQNLYPSATYTYSVEAVKPGGNIKAINTMQLHTSALEAPMAMEAVNIQPTQFMASWEEALYATGYLLDVFKLSGKADTTETEGFPNVGTGGTPLPTGWAGNASGNYTTAASSGVAAPSVGLKTNGEWIQTKTYPSAVTKFTYMYRFASTATGSSLAVYGLSKGTWMRIDSFLYVNTNKVYPVSNFTKAQEMSAFKFIYHKSAGNLAIDDVAATYGNQDTVFVLKNKAVSASMFDVTELTENTNYFYKVRSVLGNSTSDYSEVISLKTTINTGIEANSASEIKVVPTQTGLYVSGLKGDEMLQLFSVAGICVYQQKARSAEINIPLVAKGIYILKVQSPELRYCTKFKR